MFLSEINKKIRKVTLGRVEGEGQSENSLPGVGLHVCF